MNIGLRNFIKKPFVKNVAILVSGTAGAQIITMLLSPIITRLYGPENYGIMGTFMSIIAIFLPIAALTYPIAIVLPKSDQEAQRIAHLSLIVTIIITTISFITITLFNDEIVRIFKLDELKIFIYLIPVTIFFGGVLQIVEQWLIRKKQFKISARVSILQSLLIHGGMVLVGLINPAAFVLIVFTCFQYGLKGFLMYGFIQSTENKLTLNFPKGIHSLKDIAKSYKDFPLFRAPQVFLNAISRSIPILMLTSLFGPSAAGFYSLGRTVMSAPTVLIGKSVGDVFYPRISEASKSGENLTELIKKATISLALVGFIPYGLVILFGPWIFKLIFGYEWAMAGEYARWIALWIFFAFINRPSVSSLPVLKAQLFHLKFTIVELILRIFSILVGAIFLSNDLAAVALFGITGAISNLVLILTTIRFSKNFDKKKNFASEGA